MENSKSNSKRMYGLSAKVLLSEVEYEVMKYVLSTGSIEVFSVHDGQIVVSMASIKEMVEMVELLRKSVIELKKGVELDNELIFLN